VNVTPKGIVPINKLNKQFQDKIARSSMKANKILQNIMEDDENEEF